MEVKNKLAIFGFILAFTLLTSKFAIDANASEGDVNTHHFSEKLVRD